MCHKSKTLITLISKKKSIWKALRIKVLIKFKTTQSVYISIATSVVFQLFFAQEIDSYILLKVQDLNKKVLWLKSQTLSFDKKIRDRPLKMNLKSLIYSSYCFSHVLHSERFEKSWKFNRWSLFPKRITF